MGLTLDVVLAVLGAALLHAGWNTLIKSSRDVQLDTALVVFGAGLVAGPFLPFVTFPEPPVWPYLIASSVIHISYFSSLVAAFRAGDLSHSYPIMRGVAPLLAELGGFEGVEQGKYLIHCRAPQ